MAGRTHFPRVTPPRRQTNKTYWTESPRKLRLIIRKAIRVIARVIFCLAYFPHSNRTPPTPTITHYATPMV